MVFSEVLALGGIVVAVIGLLMLVVSFLIDDVEFMGEVFFRGLIVIAVGSGIITICLLVFGADVLANVHI